MMYVFHPKALTKYAESVKYYTEQRVEVAQAFIDVLILAVMHYSREPGYWKSLG